MVTLHMLVEVHISCCEVYTMLALVQHFVGVLFTTICMMSINSADKEIFTMITLFQSVDLEMVLHGLLVAVNFTADKTGEGGR